MENNASNNTLTSKQKFLKIVRFIKIYGLGRTLFKVVGRLRKIPIKVSFIRPRSLGIIGCGQFGFATIGFFVTQKERKGFLRAYDIDKDNQKSFESFHKLKHTSNYEDIVDDSDIDLVYVASNHSSHSDYAIKILDNKKDVYIEKPISVNYKQFKNLKDAIKRNNSSVYAGYNRPFSKAIRDLKKFIGNFDDVPFSLNFFISGHVIEPDHWYRNKEEGTRICGNVGHWIDLSVHILNWRSLPNQLDISIAYSNLNEIDDNINITITTEFNDIVSIMLTSRTEPFEGINETVNFQYGNTIAKIDDFRKMTLWKNELLVNKKYHPKDVGHNLSIRQPFSKVKREWKEVEDSTLLMLFIADMVKNKKTNSSFTFNEEWKKLNSL